MTLTDKTKAAMALSQAFEGQVPFANITGNFDKMGLTCGALGKTFQNGEQQRLVKTFLSRFGEDALNELMPAKGAEYIRLCRMSTSQGNRDIIKWSVTPTSANVKQPHKTELERFWTSPGMVTVQVEHATAHEGKKSQKAVDDWNENDDFHEFCFFFDIMTQQGSLKGLKRDDVKRFIQEQGNLDDAAQTIANRCRNVASSVSHSGDARKNGQLWNALLPTASRNAKELLVMGFLRANEAIEKFRFVVLNRRGTFALGEGFVNRSQHNLRDEMRMDAVAPAPLRRAEEDDDAPVPEGAAGPAFEVTASSLNLRSAPQVAGNNKIGSLKRGAIVIRHDRQNHPWWRVEAMIDGSSVVGFAHSGFLRLIEEAVPVPADETVPVSAVRAEEPAPTFRVTSSSLNFRATPEVTFGNKIGTLAEGQVVTRIDRDDHPWWRVSVRVSSQTLTGFVHSDFLQSTDETESNLPVGVITASHLRTTASVTRQRDGGRVFFLNESNLVFRNASTSAGRVNQLNAIVDYLDSGKANHHRYLPRGGQTFCNIYAYDFACLADVYIPRNWWTGASIQKLSQGIPVVPRFSDTVRELRANDLHDWFEDFGERFGWRRVFDLTDMQDAANEGGIGFIVAKRTDIDRPGHITAAVAETNQIQARREGNKVVNPVQSQAGSSNFKRKAPPQRWWLQSRFQSHGFWIHD